MRREEREEWCESVRGSGHFTRSFLTRKSVRVRNDRET